MRNTDNTAKAGSTRSATAKLAHLMKRARLLARQGQYDEAIKGIREAMAINPRNARCSVALANIYRAQNRMNLAVDAMENAVELDPRNSTVREQLLLALVELGRFDEAIAVGMKLLAESPKNLYARDMLSIAYLQQGKLDSALRLTNELIRLAPTDPLHHFKKAVLLQQKGEVSQAMVSFTRALDMDPEGEMADDAREAIAALDSYQLRQILTIAIEDAVFKTKLTLDPEMASQERGYLLSSGGIAALRQLDLDSIPGDPQMRHYH